ncbi:MAG TPA: glycosyltransferase family 4 protein [Solirubrobacterales bacterium]|nr:glycosyltransferase family 4 protein [Solirubrobacterales bacterium]
MRTLVLTPDFPPAPGGIQHLVHRTVSHAPGLECRIVTLDTPGAEEFDRAGALDVRRLPQLPAPRPVSALALNGAAVAQALAFRPRVVLSAHTVMSPGASLIRRALGVPVVQYFHGKEIGVRPRLAGFAARNADACIAVSRYTKDLVAQAGGDREKIHLIHPGVDLPNGVAAEPAERPTVLTIARMEDRYKGHDVMVRAMSLVAARIPGAQWVVIGDGPLRAAIAELACSSGIGEDVIRFLGAVSDAERDAWLDRAHVFSMPSRMPAGGYVGEGFGIVYLEANAHRCPVVAGGVGGAVDAVLDGETGLLVDPEDHISVGNALVELLQNTAQRHAMGEAGARRAEEFAWPRTAERVARLVTEIAASSAPRR